MWLCMWKLTISEEILIWFLDYFNIFALCEQFWKSRTLGPLLGPLLHNLGPLLVPFLLKIRSPSGLRFRILGSPCDCGTVPPCQQYQRDDSAWSGLIGWNLVRNFDKKQTLSVAQCDLVCLKELYFGRSVYTHVYCECSFVCWQNVWYYGWLQSDDKGHFKVEVSFLF